MQTVDFTPSPDNVPFSKPGPAPSPYNPQRPPDQFENIMGRILARSRSSASDESESPEEFLKRTRKANRPQRTGPSSPTHNGVGIADTPSSPNSPTAASSGNASSSPVKQPDAAGEANAASGDEESSNTSQSAGEAQSEGSASASTEANPGDGVSLKNILSGQLSAASETVSVDPTLEAAGQNPPAAETEVQQENPFNPNTRGSALPTGVQASGISGAKYPVPMQKAENMKQFSGSAEQNLPTAAAGISAPVAAAAVDSSSAIAPAQEAMLMRSLERTQELMSLQAVRLRDTGGDSMLVVIKPGSDLHMSLNLKMKDGHVEVEARLHHGDYDFLNRHWSDLQQQLSQRGIRLTALTLNDPSRDHQDAASSEQFRRRRSEEMSAHVRPLAASSKTNQSVKTKSSRGWESWA